MRIVLHFLGLRAGGGRTDAINLLRTLASRAPEHHFLAIVPAGYGFENVSVPSNCKVKFEHVRKFNDLWRVYYDNIEIPRICREFSADILLSMGNVGPLFISGVKHYIMLRNPHMAYPWRELKGMGVARSARQLGMRLYFQLSLLRADGVILQTQTMERNLRRSYRVTSPTFVVGKTVTDPVRTTSGQLNQAGLELVQKTGSSSFKLLYVTRYYTHKNIERACDVIVRVRKLGVDVKLFLTIESDDHPAAATLLTRLRENGIQDAVVNLGRVDLAEIADLYQSVDAVFLPTLLESFSATYLEAMAFGKPIATSDRDFAREVCGDAALYFDPASTDSAVSALQRLVQDRNLRQHLVQRGKLQYRTYRASWADIADRYLAALLGSRVDGGSWISGQLR